MTAEKKKSGVDHVGLVYDASSGAGDARTTRQALGAAGLSRFARGFEFRVLGSALKIARGVAR